MAGVSQFSMRSKKTATRVVGLGFVLSLLLSVSGCETGIATNELSSGMAEQDVVELMGEPPRSREEFTMPGNEDARFTVLEYLMVEGNSISAAPRWLLFDGDGLVTYGEGGAREAKARAFEAFYDWMSENGKMPRSEAEKLVYGNFKQLYGASLNPRVDQYLAYRVETLGKMDAGKMTFEEADRSIAEVYAELESGGPTYFGDSDQTRGGVKERTAAVARLKPDLKSNVSYARPRAGRTRRSICSSSRYGSINSNRCF